MSAKPRYYPGLELPSSSVPSFEDELCEQLDFAELIAATPPCYRSTVAWLWISGGDNERHIAKTLKISRARVIRAKGWLRRKLS